MTKPTITLIESKLGNDVTLVFQTADDLIPLHLTPLSARCTKADCKCLTREAMRYRLVFLPDLRQPPVLVVIYWRTLERQEALHRSALPLSLINCRFKPPAHRLEVVPLPKGAPLSPARRTTTVEEGVSCETRA